MKRLGGRADGMITLPFGIITLPMGPDGIITLPFGIITLPMGPDGIITLPFGIITLRNRKRQPRSSTPPSTEMT